VITYRRVTADSRAARTSASWLDARQEALHVVEDARHAIAARKSDQQSAARSARACGIDSSRQQPATNEERNLCCEGERAAAGSRSNSLIAAATGG